MNFTKLSYRELIEIMEKEFSFSTGSSKYIVPYNVILMIKIIHDGDIIAQFYLQQNDTIRVHFDSIIINDPEIEYTDFIIHSLDKKINISICKISPIKKIYFYFKEMSNFVYNVCHIKNYSIVKNTTEMKFVYPNNNIQLIIMKNDKMLYNQKFCDISVYNYDDDEKKDMFIMDGHNFGTGIIHQDDNVFFQINIY